MVQDCVNCGSQVKAGRAFTFHTSQGAVYKCLRHALGHGPMLKRSLMVCLVVGTALTLINQGDILVAGEWRASFFWKMPLTYATPFMVATLGALLNSRR
ncbi:MAG: nitrate/nitrite transporter NrtS [Chloroflexi bacterium]|nr:nitrate/nitrite transporter NrtS [Chloroflexota bacterium]